MVVIGLDTNCVQSVVPEFVGTGKLAGVGHLHGAVVSDKSIVEGNTGCLLCNGTGRVEAFAFLEEGAAKSSNLAVQAWGNTQEKWD